MCDASSLSTPNPLPREAEGRGLRHIGGEDPGS